MASEFSPGCGEGDSVLLRDPLEVPGRASRDHRSAGGPVGVGQGGRTTVPTRDRFAGGPSLRGERRFGTRQVSPADRPSPDCNKLLKNDPELAPPGLSPGLTLVTPTVNDRWIHSHCAHPEGSVTTCPDCRSRVSSDTPGRESRDSSSHIGERAPTDLVKPVEFVALHCLQFVTGDGLWKGWPTELDAADGRLPRAGRACCLAGRPRSRRDRRLGRLPVRQRGLTDPDPPPLRSRPLAETADDCALPVPGT